MTTERKAVTIYLPDNLVEYITQYCTSNEVIGKNKNGEIVPRLATGIVDLLKIVANTPVDELSTNDTITKWRLSPIAKNEIEAIKKQLVIIEDRLTTIENSTSKVPDYNITGAVPEKIEEPRIVETETAKLEEEVSQAKITPEESNKHLRDDSPRGKNNKKADTNKNADTKKSTKTNDKTKKLGTSVTKDTNTPDAKNKPLKGDSRRAKSKKKADTVKSADKPTHDGSIDINAELVLSQNKLATRLGYKNHGHLATKFKKLSRQEFIDWTKSKDPEGKGWYKTEKGFKVVDSCKGL